jgi:hypothetical protein
MTAPTFSAVRAALATYLTTSTGLRASPNRFAQVNPPMAVIMPVTGTFTRYSVDFAGDVDYTLRAIVLVSEGDSLSGQDLIDAYIATSGPQSIWAAVKADPTLGGVVSSSAVQEVTAYGLMTFSGVDYLAAHFIVSVYP